MSELQLESVPCFEHTDIQGEIVPAVPARFPFSDKMLSNMLAHCPVVVELPEPDNTPGEWGAGPYNVNGQLPDSSLGLRRISHEHGRSYELVFGKPDSAMPQAIWEDEFGNSYSSLSLKGANFSDPHVYKSLTAPSGYIPYGLLETDAFLRVIRASRILREKQVGTEMIVKVLEPQVLRYNKLDQTTGESIPNDYEYVTQPEFKRRMLQDHWKKIAGQPGAAEQFENVCEAINSMSYFFTLRATSIGTRIKDILADKDAIMAELSKAFQIINTDIEGDSQQKPEDKTLLSINNNKDIKHFLYVLLPEYIGSNLGRMHREGLVHTFPHFGNVTLFGDLVDLDSVRGEPLQLGDAPLTENDYGADLDFFLSRSLDHNLDNQVFFALIEEYFGDEVTEEFTDGQRQFETHVLMSYIENRYELPVDKTVDSVDETTFLNKLKEMQQLESRGIDFRSFALQTLLESAVDDSELPDLFSDEVIAKSGDAYVAWIEPQLRVHLLTKTAEMLCDRSVKEMDVSLDAAFFISVVNDFLYHNATSYILENYIDPVLSLPDTQALLMKWVGAQKKPDCAWSDSGLLQLVNEIVVSDTLSRFAEHHISARIKSIIGYRIYVATVLEEAYKWQKDSQEPTKLIANGCVFYLRDRFEKAELYKNLVEAVNTAPLTIIHEGGFDRHGLRIEVPDGYQLAEIFTDAPIEKVDIEDLGEQCMGKASVTVSSDEQDPSYFAYTLEHRKSGETTLYVLS